MSITIGCDIEDCKSTLTVLDYHNIASDLHGYGWGRVWVKDDHKDFHTCPKHRRTPEVTV